MKFQKQGDAVKIPRANSGASGGYDRPVPGVLLSQGVKKRPDINKPVHLTRLNPRLPVGKNGPALSYDKWDRFYFLLLDGMH